MADYVNYLKATCLAWKIEFSILPLKKYGNCIFVEPSLWIHGIKAKKWECASNVVQFYAEFVSPQTK